MEREGRERRRKVAEGNGEGSGEAGGRVGREQRGSRRRRGLHVNCRTRHKPEQFCALTGIFIERNCTLLFANKKKPRIVFANLQ